MFLDFINEYGTTILYAVITTIAGYIGIVVKNLYQRYVNDQTKRDVVKTVVQGVEQIYKDLHGEDKLNKALESASDMLALKGVNVTELELRMLIEAAVGEFNNAFNKTVKEVKTETTEETEVQIEMVI
jgi:hypothetical protein